MNRPEARAFDVDLLTPAQAARLPIPEPVLWHDDPEQPLACEGDVCVLSGAGGSGKSFVACALALAASHPKHPTHRACGLNVRPGPVVILSYEDSVQRISQRLHLITHPAPPPEHIHIWRNPVPLLLPQHLPRLDETLWDVLWRQISALEPSLLILDPAGAAIGSANPNDPAVARTLMDALARTCLEARCAALVIAHSTKLERANTQSPGQGAVAGAAAWTDSARCALLLRRNEASEQAAQLKCITANYAPDGWCIDLVTYRNALGYAGLREEGDKSETEDNEFADL